MNDKRGSRKRILLIIGGIATAFVLCGVITVTQLDHTILIRSDSDGVEFEMDKDNITCVLVKGEFPYLRVFCPHEEEFVRDENGDITEIIDTYSMEANLFLLGRSMVSMKLNIETSDDITHTYILKFADGDKKIVNGKEVE